LVPDSRTKKGQMRNRSTNALSAASSEGSSIHHGPIGGHFGIKKTIRKLQERF